ncbi:MAG TPA: amino acid adenylation domain-containing protein [Mucilaginibacter sp.]|nr:amino acid adenylation domain-containing protein [Mucilaginibacter sp.]
MVDLELKNNFIAIDFNPFEDNNEIEKIIQINESQREIWLSCAIGGDDASLAYNESISLDLTGSFHLEYFIESMNQVVSMHEALRSTVTGNGESFIVYKNKPVDITVEDISTMADQQSVLKSFITQQMHQVFDLQNGPLMRLFIHKLSHTNYYFTIVAHHIICDGWSFGVILEDLSKIYNSKVTGLPIKLDRPEQISDYAIEMADFRKTKEAEEVKEYWLNMYKGQLPFMDFPTDFPRPANRTYAANRIDQNIPQDLIDQFKKVGAKVGASMVNSLLSAFELFLYLKTNNRDVVVGIAASGQSATGNFRLVGHCVNSLSLRSQIDIDLSFANYLAQRKGAFLDAYENQNFTFGELVKTLNIPRDNSRIPLAPIAFNIDWGMDDTVSFNSLAYKLISNPRAYETFEIFLNATGSQSAFTLEWSYNTQLFKASTISQLSDEFEQLVRAIVANPDITIKELNEKTADVYKDKLAEWNNTYAEYPKESNVFELVEQTAKKYPDKVAFSFKGQTLTYSRLVQLSTQMANHLIEKGIKVGDIVGLAVNRSTEMMVSMLGILKAGGVYVPLDPEYPQDRIEYMLSDSNAKVLLISGTHQGKFKSNALEIVVDDIWDDLQKSKKESPKVKIKGTDLVYILYTSGSTGKPKGVKVRHFNLINFLTSMGKTPGVTSNDRLLAITTISFDISAFELFVPLMNGAQIILSDKEASGDPRILVELVEKENITIMITTPSTWSAMIDAGWNKKFPLKVLAGGEALAKNLADKLIDRSSEVWNNYGPTETTACTTLKRVYKEDETINIGWPIANAQVYILNEAMEPVVPGTIGEIYIGGDGVTEGYLNRPDLTSERFINNPFSDVPGAKLYKTGDLGKFFDDGDIQYFGRTDHQVKIRGLRIELGEIESVLAARKEIKEVVAMAVDGDTPEDARLVAYVSLEYHVVDTKALINDWKEALGHKVPKFMVPSSFIIVESFPLTTNNKIDKKALLKMRPSNQGGAKNIILPENDSQELIYDIWMEILGINSFSIEDDFFDLGGHSLLAVKMMSALEKHTGKRLPLAVLFENSTVKQLARKIQVSSDKTEDNDYHTLVPIKPAGTKTPVYLIHGGGLNILLFKSISKYFDDDQPVFGIQAFGLTGDEAVPPTIEEVATKHIKEILKKDPDGPYALAGYSLGGYIAFEIAKQLKAMGKEIKMLGIIDTYAGSNEKPASTTIKIAKKIRRQFYKFPFFVKSFITNPVESFEYQWIIFKYKVQKLFSPDFVIAKEVMTPREMETYKVYDNAYETYVLEPLNIEIMLFRVKKRLYYLDDRVYLGWNKYTTKGVGIHEVPGDHKTFLYPPNDQEFANVMQNVLDN